MSRASLAEIYISALPATAVAGRTPAELGTEAEQQVTAAVAKVELMRKAGDLKAANAKYKAYGSRQSPDRKDSDSTRSRSRQHHVRRAIQSPS